MRVCGNCHRRHPGRFNRCKQCLDVKSEGTGRVLRSDQVAAVERYRSKGMLDGEICWRLKIHRADLSATVDGPPSHQPTVYNRTRPLGDVELKSVQVEMQRLATLMSQARRFGLDPDLLAKQLKQAEKLKAARGSV